MKPGEWQDMRQMDEDEDEPGWHIKLSWDGVPHVDFGLFNLGVHSQMNAALQVLMHTPPFLHWVDFYSPHVEECEEVNGCVTCIICKIRLRLIAGNTNPEMLLEELHTLCDGAQLNDPFDVFLAIVSAIHHEFKNHSSSINNSVYESEASPMTSIFGSSLITNSVCDTCGKRVTTSTSLMSLQLPIDKVVSIQEALDNVLLGVSKKKRKCTSCNCNTIHDFCFTLAEHPPVLCVRLLRLQCQKSRKQRRIQISQKLSLGGECPYLMSAAILHEFNEERGHSTALVKCPNGTLLHINDSTVKRVSYGTLFEMQFEEKVYVILYKKEEPSKPSLSVAQVQNVPDNQQSAVRSTKPWTVTPTKSSFVQPRCLNNVLTETISTEPSTTSNNTPSTCTGKRKPTKEISPMQSHRVGHSDTSEKYQDGVKIITKTVYIRSIVSYEVCRETMCEKDFQFFTGLSKYNFDVLFNLLGGEEVILKLKYKYDMCTPKLSVSSRKISAKTRLFLMLIRLRRGLPVRDMAVAFNVSAGYVGLIFFAVMRHTYLTFKCLEKKMFISRERQMVRRPLQFKPFPNVRIIVDGGEFRIQSPSNFQQKGNTYSDYKSSNTVKFLVGISCYGGTMFVSEGFEGHISDKEIFLQSGLMDMLEEGDEVMSDRGFDVSAELLKIGVTLVKPPVLGEREKLTPREVLLTAAIAQARIYVEHVIGKIKENRLIRFVIPLTLHPIVSDMVYVAGDLTNFGDRRIKSLIRPKKN